MLIVRTIHDTDTVTWLCGCPPFRDAERDGVYALAAEEAGELTGFAVARSCPRAICFFWLEGDLRTCACLLERLVRQAGERDVCGWCPVRRGDLAKLLAEMKFEPQEREWVANQEMEFYYLSRND